MSSSGLRRTWPQRLVLAANVVAMLAALAVAWALSAGESAVASINRVELSASLTPLEASDLKGGRAFNVLLVGFDSAANLDPNDPIQIGRVGEQLGDVIIVARIDEVAGTAQLLSFPRDLWVEIAGLNREGKINSAFAVGGPAVLIETIEQNFAIPINNFVSIDLSGFEGLVNVVDFVELFFEYPARDWNERPSSGEARSMSGFAMPNPGCQALQPTNALAFVRSRNFQIQVDGHWRYRDGTYGDTDLNRIRRQQIFLEAFIGRAIELGARNPFVLKTLVEDGAQFVTLDQGLTVQTLLDLGRTFNQFEPSELQTYSLPTEFGFVGSASVLNELEDEAEPLLNLMRGLAANDPATVGLSVRADQARLAEAEALVAQLKSEGFDLETPLTGADTAPGVRLEFGPDGAQAVQLAEVALAAAGVRVDSVRQSSLILGREVLITFGAPDAAEPTEEPQSTPTTATPAPASAPTSPPTTVTPGGSTSTTLAAQSVRPCP